MNKKKTQQGNTSKKSFMDWLITNANIINNLSENMTVGEYIRWLFENNEIDYSSLNLTSTKNIISNIFDIRISKLTWKELNNNLKNEYPNRRTYLIQRNSFNNILLKTAINHNLINKKFNIDFIDMNISEKSLKKWLMLKVGIVSNLSETTTIGEYIAWNTQNNSINYRVLNLTKCKNIIDSLFYISLSSFSWKYLDYEIEKNFNDPVTYSKYKNKFIRMLLKPAITRDLIKEENISNKTPLTKTELTEWLTYKVGIVTKITENMSVGEFIGWLFQNKKIGVTKLNLSLSKIIIRRIIDIKISDFKEDHLKNAMVDLELSKEAFLSEKSLFKRVLLKPAILKGLLVKEYDQNWFRYEKAIHIKTKQLPLNSQDKTVSWYVCEVFKEDERSSILLKIKELFSNVWEKKIYELTENDINMKINKTNSRIFYKVFEEIYKDNQLKFNRTTIHETNKFNNFDDDIWDLKGTDGLKFKDILSTENKIMVKKWIRWRILGNYKNNITVLKELKNYFISFLEDNDIRLKMFSNVYKREWLLWIRSSNTPESVKRFAFYTVKQFLKFCLNWHRDELHEKFNLDRFKDPSKSESKSATHYSSNELDKITKSIQKEENKQFAAVLTLIMLTGKRKNEILSLKRDCLITIAGIKYLKYTNSKTNKIDRLPLQSFRLSNKKNVFKQDVDSILESIIIEQLNATESLIPLYEEEDRKFLFITNLDMVNKLGKKYIKFSNGIYRKRIKKFIINNEIDFKIDAHKFRHTLASYIIRSGKGIEVAARVLGNLPLTVSKYYETDISKEETLLLSKSPEINIIKDAKEMMKLNNTPIPIENGLVENSMMSVVPGGLCSGGEKVKKNCKYYNRLFGSGGCLGCASLGVTKENEFFYNSLKSQILVELENVSGTPFSNSVSNKLALIDRTLDVINNIGEN